jgi:hypothetical protein
MAKFKLIFLMSFYLAPFLLVNKAFSNINPDDSFSSQAESTSLIDEITNSTSESEQTTTTAIQPTITSTYTDFVSNMTTSFNYSITTISTNKIESENSVILGTIIGLFIFGLTLFTFVAFLLWYQFKSKKTRQKYSDHLNFSLSDLNDETS